MPGVWVILGLVAVLMVLPGSVCAPGLLGSSNSFDPSSQSNVYTGYVSDGATTNIAFTNVGDPGFAVYDYETAHTLYPGVGLPIPISYVGVLRLAGSVTVPATKRAQYYNTELYT